MSPDMNICALPVNASQELDLFEKAVEQFLSGEKSAEDFKNFRVPRGVYEQREPGEYMLRLRIPGGRISLEQLAIVADCAKEHGSGKVHFTTRQAVQIHDVSVEHMVPALRMILPFGLTASGGGGNTVRNITACAGGDICVRSVFDVEPYARKLTERLIKEEDSFGLPRKFKIVFSGCAFDCAEAGAADVGFIAIRKSQSIPDAKTVEKNVEDPIGFQVLVGGGLGAVSYPSVELEPFVPVQEVYLVVAAVRKIFREHGNYQNRNRARLRFLLHDMGESSFRDLYFKEKETLRTQDGWPLLLADDGEYESADRMPVRDIAPDEAVQQIPHDWQQSYIFEQRTNGHKQFWMAVPVSMGDMHEDKLRSLSSFLAGHGFFELRLTQQQNFLIPNVPSRLLSEIYHHLQTLEVGPVLPKPLAGLMVCAGPATCQLGICRSLGMARKLLELADRPYWAHPGFQHLVIRVGGCPNNCARTAGAMLGLGGAIRTKDGYSYPAYRILWGGRIQGVQSRLAEPQGIVPAKRVLAYVDRFLDRLAAALPDHADLDDMINIGRPILRDLLPEFQQVPSLKEDLDFYKDFDMDTLFSIQGRGKGECSAGE